jgi:meiotic recombination protein SPO11
MLNLIHTNVRQGKTVTQREMYYCASAKEPLLFSKVAHVLDSIKNIASLLRVNRGTLNITCSSKGLVAGLVSLRNDATQTFVDCSKLEGSGFSIPGDLKAIESVSIDASTCDFILVLEKEAVFNKLLQEKIWERYPCAIVTAKGFPDLPTRAFLHRLASSGVRETCTIFVLVDWNPAGLWIYSTYVTGGASNVNESTRYAIPNAVFLGVSHEDILAAGKVLTAKHTKKEARDIENILRKKRGPLYSIFKTELEQMHALGRKCEIEGLYASNDSDEYVFSEFLAAKISRMR